MTLLSILNRRDGSAAAAPLAEVQQVLADIQGERRSLEAVLSSPNAGKFAAIEAALEHVEQRAAGLGRQLDDLGLRAEQIGHTSRGIETLEARLAALEEGMRTAESRADQASKRAAEFDDQRWALQEMMALAQTTATRLENLKGDQEIGRLAEQVPGIREECLRIIEQHAAMVKEADILQTKSAAALQEAATAAQISRDACTHVDAATSQLDDVRRKLEEVERMDAVAQSTTAQIQGLNALAEHAAIKVGLWRASTS
jgi:predicted  nucleic acid-binding Zn-ribbon protein